MLGGDEQDPRAESKHTPPACRGPAMRCGGAAAAGGLPRCGALTEPGGVAGSRIGSRTMRMRSPWGGVLASLVALMTGALIAVPALAGSGQPSPRQIGFQEAVTPIAAQIHRV